MNCKYYLALTNIFAGERQTSFQVSQKTDPGYGVAVVDFIFTSPQIDVLSHSSPNVEISDHLPLMMDFSLSMMAGRSGKEDSINRFP